MHDEKELKRVNPYKYRRRNYKLKERAYEISKKLKPNYVQLERESWEFVFNYEFSEDFEKRILPEVREFVSKNMNFSGLNLRAVIGANRSGKTVSTIYSVLEYLIKNETPCFCVVIAFQNHTQLKYAFNVVLNSLYLIKKNYGYDWDELFKRIRVRYYRGQESACLLNYLPDDTILKYVYGNPPYKPSSWRCIRCPLYQLYRKEYVRIPNIPVAFNKLLVSHNYCPFRFLFNKKFYYKSVVLIPYDLLPVVSHYLLYFKIRNIIIIIDEYLDSMIKRVSLPLVLKKSFKLPDKEEDAYFNLLVDEYNSIMKEFLEKVKESMIHNPLISSERQMFQEYFYSFNSKRKSIYLDWIRIWEKHISKFHEVFRKCEEIRKKHLKKGSPLYFHISSLLNIIKSIYYPVDDLEEGTSLPTKDFIKRCVNKPLSVVVNNTYKKNGKRKWEVERKCIPLLIPLLSANEKKIEFGIGSWLFSSLYEIFLKCGDPKLKDEWYSCQIFLISSMRYVASRVKSGESLREFEYLPTLFDDYKVLTLQHKKKVYRDHGLIIPPISIGSHDITEDFVIKSYVKRVLRRGTTGWVVLVLNKRRMLEILLPLLEKSKVEKFEPPYTYLSYNGVKFILRGELERGVVDYVIFPRQKVCMLYGFSRCSKGIDIPEIPRDEPIFLIFLQSMRTPPNFRSIMSSLPTISLPESRLILEGRMFKCKIISSSSGYGFILEDRKKNLYHILGCSNEVLVWCINTFSQIIGRFLHEERPIILFSLSLQTHSYWSQILRVLSYLDWLRIRESYEELNYIKSVLRSFSKK